MKVVIKILISCITLTLLFTGCSNQNEIFKNRKSVAILKLGSHEIIDSVENSIENELNNKYGNKIDIRVYNANFDDTLLSQSSAQIVHENFDVVIPITTPASISLANKIKSSDKMIFSFVSTPESIWGKNVRKPKNITGTSDQLDYKKNLMLIKQIFPNATKIGYLVNASEENARDGLKQVKKFADELNLSILPVNVNAASDVANAARTVVLECDVFLVGGDNTVVSALGALLNEATKNKKPVFAVENTSVKQGCLAAYGIDYNELGKATSEMIIKVLEGTPIDKLDVNYFFKTNLYINKKMADIYGVNINRLKPYKVYE